MKRRAVLDCLDESRCTTNDMKGARNGAGEVLARVR